jgi:hypothetical protein
MRAPGAAGAVGVDACNALDLADGGDRDVVVAYQVVVELALDAGHVKVA